MLHFEYVLYANILLSFARNKSTARHANALLQLLLENSKSKKGNNYVRKNELPALLVWVPLLVVKTNLSFN